MTHNRTNQGNRNSNPPAFIAYHVPSRDKAPWTRIGAAWQHKDGEGLNLELDLIPLAGGRVVLRTYEPQEGPDEAGKDGGA